MIYLRGRRLTQPKEFAAVRPELVPGLQILSYGPHFEAHYPNPRNLGAGPALIGVGTGVRDLLGSRYGPVLGRGCTSDFEMYQMPHTALNALFAATGQATCLAVVRSNEADPVGNNGPVVLGNGGENEHYPYSDGLIYMGAFAGARWVNGVTPPVDITTPHASIFTHRSGEQTFHMAGKLLATGTRVETPGLGSAGTGPIGQNGAVYLVAVWSRVLPRKMAARLSADPWFLFSPRSIWVPVSSGGAASPVAANATYYQMIAQQRIGY